MADNNWTEVGGGGTTETWDRTGTIQGTLVKKQSDVGPNNSHLYTLKTEDGEIGVWGSAVLDTKFEQIPVGSLVRIESLGKQKSQRGVEYHDYKVMMKPAPKEVTDVFEGAEVL